MTKTLISSVVGAGLLAAALAGCSSGTGTGTGTKTSGGSVSSSGSASARLGSAPAGIPATAVLQPDDMRGATAVPLAQGEFAHVRPLRPCGTEPYPSDGTRTSAVALRYDVPGTEQSSTPSTVVEFVGRHESGGAAAQFTEITAALKRCPGGLGKDQHRWTVLESDDHSMLVKIEQKLSYADEAPATVTHYAALSTVNNAVVVVADLGWENLNGSEQLVRTLIAKAETRAAAVT